MRSQDDVMPATLRAADVDSSRVASRRGVATAARRVLARTSVVPEEGPWPGERSASYEAVAPSGDVMPWRCRSSRSACSADGWS